MRLVIDSWGDLVSDEVMIYYGIVIKSKNGFAYLNDKFAHIRLHKHNKNDFNFYYL